jgi:hypothetical protein
MTSARSSTEDRFTNYNEDQGSFSVRQKARDFIKNLLPRKPERLNDITYRFDKIKQRHMALNSAVQDLTAKLPAPSLTKGAINLNEEAGAMFQSMDGPAAAKHANQPNSAIEAAT